MRTCEGDARRATPAPRFFFFQAEDGIRDTSVTGVQTCALPISDPQRIAQSIAADLAKIGVIARLRSVEPSALGVSGATFTLDTTVLGLDPDDEIGRASCRERV